MAILFAKNPDMPTDFSRVSAAQVFNEQLVPTANRLESLAFDSQAVDLDGENQRATKRREENSERNREFLQQLEAQDNADLGYPTASKVFGAEEVEEGPGDLNFGSVQEARLPDSEESSTPGAEILTQKSGRVNPRSLEKFISNEVARSPLAGFVPKDGARYGITKGTPAEWSRFFTGLAKLESGFRNSAKGDIGKFKGDSNGLFQLSPEDARNHRLKDSEFTKEELADPTTNTKAAIAIASRLMIQDGVIAEKKRGAARYWGPLRRGKNPTKTSY